MDQQTELTCALTGWYPPHNLVSFSISCAVALVLFLVSVQVFVYALSLRQLVAQAAQAAQAPEPDASTKMLDIYLYGLAAALSSVATVPVFGTMTAELGCIPSQSSLHLWVAVAYVAAGFVGSQALVYIWMELRTYDNNGSATHSDRVALPLLSLFALVAAFVAWWMQGPPQWLAVYTLFIVTMTGSDLIFERLLMAPTSNAVQIPVNPPLLRLRGALLALVALAAVIVGLGVDTPSHALGLFVPGKNPVMYVMYVGVLIAIGICVALACVVVVVSPSISQNEQKLGASSDNTVQVIRFSAHADQVVKVFFFEIPLIYGFWVAMTTPITMSPLPIPTDLNVGEIAVAAACGVILHALLGLVCVVALICIWVGELLGEASAPDGEAPRQRRIGLKSFWRLTRLPVALLWSKTLRWLNSKPAQSADDDFLRSGVFMIALLLGSVITVLCWEYDHWPIALLAPAELLLAALAYGAVNHAISPQIDLHAKRTCILLLGSSMAFVAVLTLVVSGHDIGALPTGWNTVIDLLLVYTILALIDAIAYAVLHLRKPPVQDFVADPLRWELTVPVVAAVTLFAATGEFANITANAGLTGAVCLEAGAAAIVYLFVKPLIDLAARLRRRVNKHPETTSQNAALDHRTLDTSYTPPIVPEVNDNRQITVREPAKPKQFSVYTSVFAYLMVFYLMFAVVGLSSFFSNPTVDLIIPLIALSLGFYSPSNQETDAERRNLSLFFLVTLLLLFIVNALVNPPKDLHALAGSHSPLMSLWDLPYYQVVTHLFFLEGLFLLALVQLGYLLFLTLEGIKESYHAIVQDN